MTRRSSPKIVLQSDEVHLWTACLEQPPQRLGLLEQTLCAEERERADRFRFERDRSHFIAGRGLLRMLLAGYLGSEPQQIEFRYADNGKPELVQDSAGVDLRFNCTHSQQLALYAIADGRRIGVDVEALRDLPDADEIARFCFSARENARLRSLSPEQKRQAFFNGWTRKEAYLKAVGEGLRRPLDRVEVTLAPAESAALLSVDGDRQAASRWSLEAPSVGPCYAAALVVEGVHRLTRCGSLSWLALASTGGDLRRR